MDYIDDLGYDDEDIEYDDYEFFVNYDEPYMRYVQVDNGEGHTFPGVIFTSLDLDGEKVRHCYDWGGVSALQDSLTEIIKNLAQMSQEGVDA